MFYDPNQSLEDVLRGGLMGGAPQMMGRGWASPSALRPPPMRVPGQPQPGMPPGFGQPPRPMGAPPMAPPRPMIPPSPAPAPFQPPDARYAPRNPALGPEPMPVFSNGNGIVSGTSWEQQAVAGAHGQQVPGMSQPAAPQAPAPQAQSPTSFVRPQPQAPTGGMFAGLGGPGPGPGLTHAQPPRPRSPMMPSWRS